MYITKITTKNEYRRKWIVMNSRANVGDDISELPPGAPPRVGGAPGLGGLCGPHDRCDRLGGRDGSLHDDTPDYYDGFLHYDDATDCYNGYLYVDDLNIHHVHHLNYDDTADCYNGVLLRERVCGER